MSALIDILGAKADIVFAVGLVIAAVAIVVLNKIGLLPKKAVPYAIFGVLAVFGISWARERRRGAQLQRLREEEKRLKALEEEMAKAAGKVNASNAALEAARSRFEARRTALEESAAEVESGHAARVNEIANFTEADRDREMSALLARLRKDRTE